MNHIIALIIVILVNIQAGYGQQSSDSNKLLYNKTLDSRFTTFLDSCINYYMNLNHIPGVSLTLVKDTATLYMKAYGIAAADRKDSVTINTAFELASTTKLFTATAIMQLYEKGKIELDSPLVKYIPFFKIKGAYKEITIRHLLNHTSGMVRDMTLEERKGCRDGVNCLEEHVRSLYKRKLISSPGKEYNYSNVGYSILAYVVAQVSKQSYEQYVKQNIFDVLGMNHSTFDVSNIVDKTAHHEIHNSQAVVVKDDYMNAAINGTGALYSSIYDMNLWAKAFLANGHYLNHYIIQEQTFKMMLHPEAKTGDNCNGCFSDVGLGWNFGTYNGNTFEGKGGNSYYGAKSTYLLWPKQSLGIVLLGNSDSGNDGAAAVFLMDKLIEYLNK